jgi:ribosomal protein L32
MHQSKHPPHKENASKKRKQTKRKTSQKSDLNLQNEDDTNEIYLNDGICEVCMMNTPLN